MKIEDATYTRSNPQPFQRSQWSLHWTTIQNFNFSLGSDPQKKNSYERRAYESVDNKSLSQKTMKNGTRD